MRESAALAEPVSAASFRQALANLASPEQFVGLVRRYARVDLVVFSPRVVPTSSLADLATCVQFVEAAVRIGLPDAFESGEWV